MIFSRARLIIVFFVTLMLSQTQSIAAPSATLGPTDAKLTETHGSVYKRAFVDWTKETLSDPEPASTGDILHEGMQVGTAQKSWAQITWKHLTARAWENSVYAIAPNQRLVYLVNGEMLYQLDKHRKDKSAYYVWTNVLQARIRGTTVLFQATKDTSRITVLEGTVEVLNKLDKSTVTLKPGVVYEVATPGSGAGASTTSTMPFTNITSSASPMVPIFTTAKSRTSVAAIDPIGVLNHPLIREFDNPLPSLPLVSEAMTTVQSLLDVAGDHIGTAITTLLHDTLEITSAPKSSSYTLGADVQAVARVAPGAFDFFTPIGVVGPSSGASPIQVGQMVPSNTVLPNLLGTTVGGFTLSSGATTAAIPMATSTATITGVTGTVVNAGSGAVGATVSAAGGSAGSLLGTTGTLLGNTTSAVGSTTSGLLNQTTNTLNQTLNTTLGAVNGLLGH